MSWRRFLFSVKKKLKNPPFHSISSASQIQTFNVAVVFTKMKFCFASWCAAYPHFTIYLMDEAKNFRESLPHLLLLLHLLDLFVSRCYWLSLPFGTAIFADKSLLASNWLQQQFWMFLFTVRGRQFRPYSVHSIRASNGNCSHLHYSHTEDIDEDIKTTCTVCSWCVIFYYDYFFNWVTEPVLFDTGITQPLFLESEDSCRMNLFF